MKSNELNRIWEDIENRPCSENHFFQRIVCIDLLYRVYIGVSGIPSKRFLSIEIPDTCKEQFDSFTEPKGFTLIISAPTVKHEGYVSCVLEAAASDQNDVFTIVAEDIVNALYKRRHSSGYVNILKSRIEKWREFFKNKAKKQLAEKTVIGLIGELTFLKELITARIQNAVEMWNGPIKASQDFQGDNTAAEVKTASTNRISHVHISSEMQLDQDDRDVLFLVVYRIERNDAGGIKLPSLIEEIANLLDDRQKARFWASLTCLGYFQEDEKFYSKGYSIKERMAYKIKEEFPCILRKDIPPEISDVKYKLSLQNCSGFAVDMETVVREIKELENGEN